MAIPNSIPAGDVANGLRMWAARQDGHVRAAIELLIANNWHHIPAFREVMCEPEASSGWYTIRWSYARRAFDRGGFDGIGGSRAGEILDFAVALGENRYGCSVQGDVAAREMIEALATALGMHVSVLTPVR